MTLLGAFFHLLELLAPALCVAAISAGLAKLLWRTRLRTVRWRRLAGFGAVASAAVLVAGLIAFGQDGRMATYGAMLLANAAALWWAGFSPSRH
jgi:hypothetical protein